MPRIDGVVAPGKKPRGQAATRIPRSLKREPFTAAPASEAAPPDVPSFQEAREEMIRVAAYYRAEKRGFVPGMELSDWLAAEADIEARLNE